MGALASSARSWARSTRSLILIQLPARRQVFVSEFEEALPFGELDFEEAVEEKLALRLPFPSPFP